MKPIITETVDSLNAISTDSALRCSHLLPPPDRSEIVRILDKVRQSGYENLTPQEKQTLFDASKK